MFLINCISVSVYSQNGGILNVAMQLIRSLVGSLMKPAILLP